MSQYLLTDPVQMWTEVEHHAVCMAADSTMDALLIPAEKIDRVINALNRAKEVLPCTV